MFLLATSLSVNLIAEQQLVLEWQLCTAHAQTGHVVTMCTLTLHFFASQVQIIEVWIVKVGLYHVHARSIDLVQSKAKKHS